MSISYLSGLTCGITHICTVILIEFSNVHHSGIVDLTNENGKNGATVDLSVLSNFVTVNTNKTVLAPGLASSSTVVTVFGIPIYVGSALVPKKHVVVAERLEPAPLLPPPVASLTPPPPPPVGPLVHAHKSSSYRMRADSATESGSSAGSASSSGNSASSSSSSTGGSSSGSSSGGGIGGSSSSTSTTSSGGSGSAASASGVAGANTASSSSSSSSGSLLNNQRAEFEVERIERRKNSDMLIDLFRKFDAKLQQQSETIRELKLNQASIMSKIQKREQHHLNHQQQ